jgi:hypothetical protein
VDENAKLPSSSKPRRPLWARITLWAITIALLVTATALTVFAIYVHRAEPILRKRVIETLATKYDSRVELAGFEVSVIRGVQVTGSGLKIYPESLDTQHALFAVKQFSFHASWHDLFRTPMHVGRVRVSGLVIHLPPKSQRDNIPRLNNKKSGKIQIFVDQLDIDHASLILDTKKPNKVPLDFEILNLHITSLGANKPMHFHAILVNPKPIGNIDSSASFGPFNTQNPGDTPVNGIYSFKNADLGTLKGIGGTLSSMGRYSGTLNNIVVDGETDTPNFSLKIGGRPLPLHTTFHAIVDGTNGDTHLAPVDAILLHSHIIARGDVIDVPNHGHHIVLNVVVDRARIEDMLALAVNASPPMMSGELVLHTHLDLPPGDESVTDKLRLQGSFNITGVNFSNPKIQQRIDELSLRSQGHAGKANEVKEKHTDPQIRSDVRGQFALVNSRLTLTGLNYTVPGAHVVLHGNYALNSGQLDFKGTARLDAKVSQMVTGWKSWLLTPVDPFFSKNGAGTEVPISITGTRSNPKYSVQLFH